MVKRRGTIVPLAGMILCHPDEVILFANTTQSMASATSQAPSSIVDRNINAQWLHLHARKKTRR